uniref:Uncharacterized protein n=1 Tax=Cajanus cajan TaxID=3821 RepID=A0A151RD50_CAJCA|nr:hypothetical protein KK1_038213 [Cajanus cajan]
MPKERRDRSVSHDSCRVSPYPSSSSRVGRSAPKEAEENVKEWEEARCPVCMEHPHNAVLLICSSHDKGCRPYMCNTSYRHSNCLDQFCKSFTDTSSTIPQVEVCPLCRGQIKEWKVVEAARHFMNEKSRSCSCETCNFSGTYTDLRKHARLEHPLERPSAVDPERQRNWRRLERQRDLGDLLSTLQTSFGVDDPIDDGGLLAVFFLILQPASVSRGTTLQMRIRRPSTLWGENYEGQSGSDDANESSDGGSDSRPRRVRRRMTPPP